MRCAGSPICKQNAVIRTQAQFPSNGGELGIATILIKSFVITVLGHYVISRAIVHCCVRWQIAFCY